MNIKHTALALSLLGLGAAQAAPIKAGKVGFVDIQKVVQSTSAGANYIKLSQSLNTDLNKRIQDLQAIQAKIISGKATAADRAAFAKAQTSYQAAVQSANAQRQKAFGPLSNSVNAAVAKAAQAQGYTVVMNRAQAARGLVVYANTQTTDLTAATQKYLK